MRSGRTKGIGEIDLMYEACNEVLTPFVFIPCVYLGGWVCVHTMCIFGWLGAGQ